MGVFRIIACGSNFRPFQEVLFFGRFYGVQIMLEHSRRFLVGPPLDVFAIFGDKGCTSLEDSILDLVDLDLVCIV
jgi:hypothetical protein